MQAYLDNAATTKMHPEVFAAMRPYFMEHYGNPGSHHNFGFEAARAVREARLQVAELFHAGPENIIFTSGGTESNNMVIRSILMGMIVTSEAEHVSVLDPTIDTMSDCLPEFMRPDATGGVSADTFERFLDRLDVHPSLVSLMWVNNETGAVSDIPGIAAICHSRGIPLHVDCVQAAGFLDLNSQEIPFDFASVSAHKIHGPKGVGCLYVRDPKTIGPLIMGGQYQEWGLRGGTENVPGIVGFGEACRIARERLQENVQKIGDLRRAFLSSLRLNLQKFGGDISNVVRVNGPDERADSRILSLTIKNVDAESLILILNARGVCVSAGSACHGQSVEPSYVLKAMGFSDEEASSTLRVSFSDFNTRDEIVYAAMVMAEAIWMLVQNKL